MCHADAHPLPGPGTFEDAREGSDRFGRPAGQEEDAASQPLELVTQIGVLQILLRPYQDLLGVIGPPGAHPQRGCLPHDLHSLLRVVCRGCLAGGIKAFHFREAPLELEHHVEEVSGSDTTPSVKGCPGQMLGEAQVEGCVGPMGSGGFVNYIWPHRDDQIWPHPWARGTGYSASMNALSGGPDSRAVSGLWAMGGSFTSGCWRRGSVGPAGGGGVYGGGWGGAGEGGCLGGPPPG